MTADRTKQVIALALILVIAAMAVAVGVRLASQPWRPTPAPVVVEVWG